MFGHAKAADVVTEIMQALYTVINDSKTRVFYIKIMRKYGCFMSEKCVLFFEKSEVIFTK